LANEDINYMTAAETAEVAAEYATPWIERLARAGFAAKALLYGTGGVLAARMMPSEQLLAEMGKYNEELAKAGVMLAGEGLHPSSKGARVRFSGDKRTVIDGPFAESKELVAGFWLWQVKSKEEAIEWLKRAPFEDSEVEIRQVFEAEDFGAEFTPELHEQEKRVWEQAAENAKRK